MALNLDVGDVFPDVSMADHTGQSLTISEVAQGQPLFLALFRGPW